jgi:hypothetical protein
MNDLHRQPLIRRTTYLICIRLATVRSGTLALQNTVGSAIKVHYGYGTSDRLGVEFTSFTR